MVGAVAVEMVRPVHFAEHDHSAVLGAVVPDEEVELRFLLPFRGRDALEQAVEELAYGLGSASTQREDAPHIMLVMVYDGFLDAGEILELARDVVMDVVQPVLADAVHQRVQRLLQREDAVRAGLEVEMLGSGCPALRAVVEHGISAKRTREVEHIHEMMPDGLGDVPLGSDHKVAGKYRERIDLDAVLAALAPLEGKDRLLRREILPAKEARRVLEGVRRRPCDCRCQPGGIVLQHNLQPVHLHLAGGSGLQAAEAGGDLRPDRELVIYELLYLLHNIL